MLPPTDQHAACKTCQNWKNSPVLLKERFGDEGEQVILGCGGLVPNVLALLLPTDWMGHNAVCVLSLLLTPSEQPPTSTGLLPVMHCRLTNTP